MTRYTPLTVLQASASQYSNNPVFKVPHTQAPDSDQVEEWESISYAQFEADVELHSKYWARKLSEDGVPSGAVVALW